MVQQSLPAWNPPSRPRSMAYAAAGLRFRAGVYHLVVHVFNQRTSLRGSEVQVMVALRSGLVTILPSSEVLESSCGVETCVFSRCCYWWVGTVTKEGTSFNFQPANAVIKKPSRC